LYLVFKIPYMYDYKTKLCRTQAEVILNYANPNIRGTGQREARPTTVQLTNCNFRVVA
jgi:hypothetical protein